LEEIKIANQYEEWTKDQIQFIKDNYLKMSDEEIGIKLNRTELAIKTKRLTLGLKRERRKINYPEEIAKEQLICIFNEIKRPPTKEDGKIYKMKPSRDWYVDKYGSIENACVVFGLIEKPLAIEERVEVSIIELKTIAKELNRIPICDEYIQMKDKGYSIQLLKKHLNMTYSQICNKYLNKYIEKAPKGYKKCFICNEIKQINEFGKQTNSKTAVWASCKLCEYLKRNKISIPNNWSEKQCKILIDNILNEKIRYLNELCSILNKELDDIANVLNEHIKIANKPLNVKVNCAYCNKEEIKYLCNYLNSKQYFCSLNCYWNFKRECEPKGKDHPSYNRIEKKCDNCGVDIQVIPWSIENNQHNFCSQECYWDFRGKFYVGENHPQYGVERTPEQRRKMRIITTNRYTTGSFKRLTKPQIKVNEMLNELNIIFENEFNCKYYSIDNYLIKYNLMIEVQGDYFHSNPLLFSNLNKMQRNGIIRDKRKRTYIKRYKDINILYLWENNIKKNLELCKKLILKYISNNGILDDYNSFNYSLIDENVILNKEIIIPYIDWNSKDLNNITYEKKEIV
jgi:hypothetical protein